jgi:hypothetical protein
MTRPSNLEGYSRAKRYSLAKGYSLASGSGIEGAGILNMSGALIQTGDLGDKIVGDTAILNLKNQEELVVSNGSNDSSIKSKRCCQLSKTK